MVEQCKHLHSVIRNDFLLQLTEKAWGSYSVWESHMGILPVFPPNKTANSIQSSLLATQAIHNAKAMPSLWTLKAFQCLGWVFLMHIAQVYGSDFLNLINYSLSKYLLRDTFSTPCTSNVRQHKSGHQIRIIIILPVQLYPSPLKPLSHSHVYEPSVFVQMAFLSHLCLPSIHSSLS